ncbi:hypothetical protein BCR44DRAFT_1462047 [Catenaria anguillulae PL171]|uniref:Uncharacterized protein n=1 Tax=Catenaria anguillulae PL171 TaxID=765915 RepID=A0A1Y2HJM6_9FUNG|nr:hypothetical protein BCR44DRAFT_1462047 [Catenaria anguillulae PL171]
MDDSADADPVLAANARPRTNLATFREPPAVIDSLAFALSSHLGAIRPSPPATSATADQPAPGPTNALTGVHLTDVHNLFASHHMRSSPVAPEASNSVDSPSVVEIPRRAIYFDPLRRDRLPQQLHGTRRDSAQPLQPPEAPGSSAGATNGFSAEF